MAVCVDSVVVNLAFPVASFCGPPCDDKILVQAMLFLSGLCFVILSDILQMRSVLIAKRKWQYVWTASSWSAWSVQYSGLLLASTQRQDSCAKGALYSNHAHSYSSNLFNL